MLKAAYINEIYKLSKKKKITISAVLYIISVAAAAIIAYSVNSFTGVKISGSSELSILILTVLSYTLIPLFAAFVCIDMFSGEFTEQTIKLTLTSPASRFKIYSAKVLAQASFIMANLLFIMLLSVTASIFVQSTSFNIGKILLSYLLAFFPVFIFSLAVSVISNITKGTASAFMLSVLIFILFNGIGIFFPHYKSFLFTSTFDWYRLALGSFVNLSKLFRVFLILCGYGIMLFAAGFYLFDKKEI